jgi:hypothetical protein
MTRQRTLVLFSRLPVLLRLLAIGCVVASACIPDSGGGCGTEPCAMNDAGFCACGMRRKDCYCVGMVRFGAPTLDIWVPTRRFVNGSIVCHEDQFEDLEVNANLECGCCVRNDSCTIPTTTTTPAPTLAPTTTTTITSPSPTELATSRTTTQNTSAAHTSTSAPSSNVTTTPPPPTTTRAPTTNVTLVTNASIVIGTTPNSTNITVSPRQRMDRAAVQALTNQATVVVATTVAVAMGASVAGAASGPGVLAIIGQVQMLSQTGKIGGAKTALGQMSDGFEWANAELPFSPWLIISDGLSMRRSGFRRKNKIPPPGQTQKSMDQPEVILRAFAFVFFPAARRRSDGI